MSSVAPSPLNVPVPKAELVAHRRKELSLARALGVGVGVFLLFWSPMSLARWSHMEPMWAHIESGFFILYGLLLLVPYGRARNPRRWRFLFGTLAVASLMFMFVLIFDVLFVASFFVENKPGSIPDPDAGRVLYVYSEDSGTYPKLPFPALNCALVFIGLMQVPVVLFSRHPDWMD